MFTDTKKHIKTYIKIIYGLNKTLPYIKRTGRIYVGEAEKFVLELWSHGVRNTGGTGGKELSQYQIDMLIRLGVEVIFCFDEDVKMFGERLKTALFLYGFRHFLQCKSLLIRSIWV